MTEAATTSSKGTTTRQRWHDRIMSLLLATIWMMAAILVWKSDTGIPTSMLLVGTVFFMMLVPAMKELVKVLDKLLRGQLGSSETIDD